MVLLSNTLFLLASLLSLLLISLCLLNIINHQIHYHMLAKRFQRGGCEYFAFCYLEKAMNVLMLSFLI